MDGAEVAVAVVQAVAWPVTLAGLAILFRGEVKRIFAGTVRKLKVGDFIEITFDKMIPVLRKQIAESPVRGPDRPGDERVYRSSVSRAAPDGGLESVRAAESYLRARLVEFLPEEVAVKDSDGVYEISLRLEKLGLVDSPTTGVVANVALLGNLASRSGEELSASASREYVDLVEEVLRRLPKSSLAESGGGGDGGGG